MLTFCKDSAVIPTRSPLLSANASSMSTGNSLFIYVHKFDSIISYCLDSITDHMLMKNSSRVYITSSNIMSTGKQTITNQFVLLLSVIDYTSSNDDTNISLLGKHHLNNVCRSMTMLFLQLHFQSLLYYH